LNSGGVGMVQAQNTYLYAGFGNTGQLFGWVIDASGNLTTISGSPYSESFLGGFIGGVGQSNMITNPAGTLLFGSDAVGGKVYVFQIGTGGVLAPVSGSPFSVPLLTPVFTPMNLAIDGLGKYLYVVDGTYSTHTGTKIAAYSIGTGSGGTTLGALTPVVGSPFSYPMFQLVGEPTGQFMIGTSGNSVPVSGADDNHLYVFTITQSGANAGAIAQVAGSPFATVYSPLNIAAQPNSGGDLVYSFGINDTDTAFNPVEGYTISSTGQLTAVSGGPFSLGNGEGSFGQFDPSGLFLFTYASYLNSTTNSVTTLLSPINVATGGSLTQQVGTLTLATPGFWAVTDPN
jgi:hypothetical protein